MGKTHIQITEERRNDLRLFKAERGMTYDQAIAELLESYNDEP
jgi:hypothetical protein